MNNQMLTIKLMIKDFLYYGYNFKSFIEFDYPICKDVSLEDLQALWRKCINELETM